ncbi:MAG: hypothetical protein SXV54_25530 [Chloroflexota bacterium]|nr:hypothetical protein [Chloroflexota bacterium]
MRKAKFVSVFVLLALLLSAGPGAVMAQEPPPQSLPQVASVAVLTNNETGQRFELPVTTRIQAIGPDVYEVQYQAEIPTAILRGDYDEKSRIDPTYSARVTIHQNYSEKYIGGIPYVAVYYYKGRWERLDPAVACTKLNVVASCWVSILTMVVAKRWRLERYSILAMEPGIRRHLHGQVDMSQLTTSTFKEGRQLYT